LEPHWHDPDAEQLSAVAVEQAVHAFPGAPQNAIDVGITQYSPEQQPPGHDVMSHVHAPLKHR
jgi:hypothetical protein